jgi:hypothetical protein
MIPDIEIVARTDEYGRHVLEMREVGIAVPVISNEQLLGIRARARRQGLEAFGNIETGEILFRPHAQSRGDQR